ncbi:MAG: hypothetical protein LAO20_04075 [Acidobacteriia bacterium]|nr:hypothetical protein [Terriglobia bacterium]
MNCQQFQEVLPEIMDTGGSEQEEEHLRTCPSCAGLVQDLETIAGQAKLLMPMHDPNPRVWAGIEQALQREGLLREGRTPRLGAVIALPPPVESWTRSGWVMAAVAVLAFAAVLITYRPQPNQISAQKAATPAIQFDGEDQQLLSQVAQQEPVVRRAYEDSLREVNAYIVDARQAIKQDPDDTVAQEHLADAYQQKEMLYQMATARSLP